MGLACLFLPVTDPVEEFVKMAEKAARQWACQQKALLEKLMGGQAAHPARALRGVSGHAPRPSGCDPQGDRGAVLGPVAGAGGGPLSALPAPAAAQTAGEEGAVDTSGGVSAGAAVLLLSELPPGVLPCGCGAGGGAPGPSVRRAVSGDEAGGAHAVCGGGGLGGRAHGGAREQPLRPRHAHCGGAWVPAE